MTTNLITFKCDQCGMLINAHIDRKGVLKFAIDGEIYDPKDVLTNKGYFVCIDLKAKTDIRFKVFV